MSKNIDILKIPPHEIEAETAVLGAILLEREALPVIAGILNPESFYMEKHVKIFEAILRLSERNSPVEILTVVKELKASGDLEFIGGAYYVTTLTNHIASAANIEFHARIIQQEKIKRDIIHGASELIRKGFDETSNAFDLIADLGTLTNNVSIGSFTKKEKTSYEIHAEILKNYGNNKQVDSVFSGLRDIDSVTQGFQKSDLIIVAARPGMGKSSLAATFCRNAAIRYKKPVGFFSLEMSSIQVGKRDQSVVSSIPLKKIRGNNLSHHELTMLNNDIIPLLDAKIIYDDTPGISMMQLRAKAKLWKAKYGIELLIIDYLQLINGRDGVNKSANREQEISYISRSLKAIAKELDIPVIALSQLSRDTEKRGGEKKPALSDLRDSGAIEQDADMVMFIYRPEYYGITEAASGNSTIGKAEIIIAKHRNGELRSPVIGFDHNTTGFYDLEYQTEKEF